MIKNIIEMLKEYDPEVGAGIEAEYKRPENLFTMSVCRS